MNDEGAWRKRLTSQKINSVAVGLPNTEIFGETVVGCVGRQYLLCPISLSVTIVVVVVVVGCATS